MPGVDATVAVLGQLDGLGGGFGPPALAVTSAGRARLPGDRRWIAEREAQQVAGDDVL
jgi:hypothetical protein